MQAGAWEIQQRELLEVSVMGLPRQSAVSATSPLEQSKAPPAWPRTQSEQSVQPHPKRSVVLDQSHPKLLEGLTRLPVALSVALGTRLQAWPRESAVLSRSRRMEPTF